MPARINPISKITKTVGQAPEKPSAALAPERYDSTNENRAYLVFRNLTEMHPPYDGPKSPDRPTGIAPREAYGWVVACFVNVPNANVMHDWIAAQPKTCTHPDYPGKTFTCSHYLGDMCVVNPTL